MKTTLSRLIGIAALAGLLFAVPVEASTSVARPTRVDLKRNLQVTTLQYTITSIAQNVIDTCIVNVGPYARWNIGASSVASLSYTIAFDAGAADSVNTALDVGPTASGPWKEIYALNINARTLYYATPYFTGSAIVCTTLPMLPYWRIRAKNKSATAYASKNIYIMFPALSTIPVQ
jgi:hypothetical protein